MVASLSLPPTRIIHFEWIFLLGFVAFHRTEERPGYVKWSTAEPYLLVHCLLSSVSQYLHNLTFSFDL